MRRLSFHKVSGCEEEQEEEEEEGDEQEEFLEGGGGEYYYSKVTLTASPTTRRSFNRSSSLLSLVSLRKSYSYDKLCQVPIQLTVVKLDASSFEIDVRKMATIAELKQAVERRFCHLPTKGPGKISWRHVWGHFCLTYRGQKLLNDSDFMKDYGIKEGDQLLFVRHTSVGYNLIKKQSWKRIEAPKLNTMPEHNKEESKKLQEYDDVENLRCDKYNNEIEENSTQNECMLSHLCKGLFPYSKLSSREHLRSEQDTAPSRWAGGFLGCFRSLFHFCDNKPPRYSSIVSQVEI